MVKYFLAVSDQGVVVYSHNSALERPWHRYEPVLAVWQDAGPPPATALLFKLGAPYERTT